MRVESGRPMANGGWLHRGDKQFLPPPPLKAKEEKIEPLNVDRWINSVRCIQNSDWMDDLAKSLGVSLRSLEDLNCKRAPQSDTAAFPMRDGFGRMVGIRLRHQNGQKWAVKGSKQGIFLPQCPTQDLALICEGPTDTAAALTLGFFAIGRPSCSGGHLDIEIAIRRLRISRVALIVDNDDAGINGAKRLQEDLKVPSVVVIMPCKDIRRFLNQGGNHDALKSTINSLVWKRP